MRSQVMGGQTQKLVCRRVFTLTLPNGVVQNWLVGEGWGCLKELDRESLACCTQGLMGNSGGVQKTRVQICQYRLIYRAHAGIRKLLEIGLIAFITSWQRTKHKTLRGQV